MGANRHVDGDCRRQQSEGEEKRRGQVCHDLSPFLSTALERGTAGFDPYQVDG
jgi:hypothetical protein